MVCTTTELLTQKKNEKTHFKLIKCNLGPSISVLFERTLIPVKTKSVGI